MSKSILIVDNDPAILDAMQEVFSYEGYDVVVAEGTEDIISLVDHHKPDLLVLDYILNGINGGELCHLVKVNQTTCTLPVVIMSAYPRVLQSLGTYGSNEFIAKPFDLYDLVNKVSQLIHN
jgi:DNA-binding response OmpR family regulator